MSPRAGRDQPTARGLNRQHLRAWGRQPRTYPSEGVCYTMGTAAQTGQHTETGPIMQTWVTKNPNLWRDAEVGQEHRYTGWALARDYHVGVMVTIVGPDSKPLCTGKVLRVTAAGDRTHADLMVTEVHA